MAIIEKNLFSWQEVSAESDLSRLGVIMELFPDESVMKHLERERGNGRDDYPIRAVWNSILAGIVYEHPSVESLRRELRRNGQLRDVCGFDPILGEKAVPTPRAYSYFLKTLLKHRECIEEMFDTLVGELKKELGDYGKYVGVDSKRIDSYGKKAKNKKRDGRRDNDADWGRKEYRGKREDGTLWEKAVKWFGYKVHLLVDTKYELPIGYKVTKASRDDSTVLPVLLEETANRHEDILERAEEASGDRGYDSAENNRELWDKYGIKPVIDIRNMWKDGEETRSLYPERADNIVYDYKGGVYCYCEVSGARQEMAYMGFEKERETLKYRCPAAAYGMKCKSKDRCKNGNGYGRVVRIPLETDRRIFTPIARSSYAWKRKYKRRTAVERVNSRLDMSFGFERHFIRGQAKMEVRVGLAMCVMLCLALGSIRKNQREKMRSLVTPRNRVKEALQEAG